MRNTKRTRKKPSGPISVAFKKNVRRLREEWGYTQGKVAELTGVSIDSVKSYEHGRSFPELHVVDSLARIFGVHPMDLLTNPEALPPSIPALFRVAALHMDLLELMTMVPDEAIQRAKEVLIDEIKKKHTNSK